MVASALLCLSRLHEISHRFEDSIGSSEVLIEKMLMM